MTERPMKWRFDYIPSEGSTGKPGVVEFDSTAGLLAFLLAGANVVAPGLIIVRYTGNMQGGMADIVPDLPLIEGEVLQ